VDLIKTALSQGLTSLSEFESKRFLASYGILVTREKLADTPEAAREAAGEIGYPVALKGSGPGLLHKTELDLIRLNLKDEAELLEAYDQLAAAAKVPLKEMLVQEMVTGDRELVAGMVRDPQFGPSVMFGLGGIYTEALGDVVFRVAPLSRWDALQMMEEFRGRKTLDAFRGLPPVVREGLADMLITLGKIGLGHPSIREIDINPLKIQSDGRPIAVDALIILD
jgi:succinyl-CoA synthetase beta subunit